MSSTDEFPGNIVFALREELRDLAFVNADFGRPLRPIDPNGALGVSPRDWVPTDWQIGQVDPAVSRYMIQLEALIRHTDEEQASALHNLSAKTLRVMLYRDPALRTRLLSLSETNLGVVERVQRYGIQQQRFAANQVDNEFVFFSVIDLWVETEIV